MGCILRCTVPTTRPRRQPQILELVAARAQDKQNKARQKRNRGERQLPPLESGDQVWLPQKQREGEVQSEVAP